MYLFTVPIALCPFLTQPRPGRKQAYTSQTTENPLKLLYLLDSSDQMYNGIQAYTQTQPT